MQKQAGVMGRECGGERSGRMDGRGGGGERGGGGPQAAEPEPPPHTDRTALKFLSSAQTVLPARVSRGREAERLTRARRRHRRVAARERIDRVIILSKVGGK